MRSIFAVAITLSILASHTPVRGQEEVVSVDEVVRLAREDSPTARALAAVVAVADADVDLAGVYSNPTFSYVGMARFDGSNAAINGTQHQVWFEIPILLGQNEARRDAARGAAVAAHAALDVALLEVEVEARRRYVDLVAAEARVRELEAARVELQRLASLVEGRTRAGALSDYDLARMALALAQADADLAVAQADVHAASSAIASWLGRPDWRPRADASLETHAIAYRDVESLPTVIAARRRVDAAERDVRRAEMERIPEISLGAGAYFTTDGDSGSAYLGLSMPLPVFDTGEAAVHRAEAARAAAIEAAEATETMARVAITGRLGVLSERRAALEAFDASVASRVSGLVEMAESAYRLGASGVFELLDAFGARLTLALTRIDLLTAAIQSEIDLLAVAAGGAP